MEYSVLDDHFLLPNSLYSSAAGLRHATGKDDLGQKAQHSAHKATRETVEIMDKNDFETAYPILLKTKREIRCAPGDVPMAVEK